MTNARPHHGATEYPAPPAPVVPPLELREFLEEQRDLERLHSQGILTRQEFSRAKRNSLLAWLFINNPDLFRQKPALHS